MARQHFDRHIELTPGGMKRKGAQQPCNRVGDAGRSRDFVGICAQNLGRQRNQCRGRLDRIGVEIGERRHRIVVEIEQARLDEIAKRGNRKVMTFDRLQQRRRDRIGGRLPAPLPTQHVDPPLQADFARQRLTRNVAHARHFGIEGIEGIERAAMLGRCEQGGEEAVLVRRADQLLAMGEGILHGRLYLPAGGGAIWLYSTAIRAAPTRRFSISSTL